MARKALEGIRVVDFSYGAALPETFRMCGEFGAEVIEIACSEHPEFMRRVGINFDINMGAAHNEAYRNKKCLGLNLETHKGREIAMELIKKSDIVGESYRASVMINWGLDYESVRKVKPDIIYVSSHGWGFGGPYEMYQTYGPHAQHVSGLTWLWNHPDSPYPIGGNLTHPDHIAPKVCFIALLAALEHKRRTGKGQFIDLSQNEVAAGLIGEVYLDVTMNNRLEPPMGNRSNYAAPHGCYKCKGLVNYEPGYPHMGGADIQVPQGPTEDCWIAISVFNEEEWEGLCNAMGNPAWTKNPKFATLTERLRNVDELDQLIEDWTQQHDPFEAMDVLQNTGVPAGVVECVEDQILRDQQLKYRGFIIELDHPVAGSHLYAGQPIKLSGTPALPSTYAPMIGEHTDELMQEMLGMSTDEIGRLKEEKVLE
ncbi:MAG: CoA transferase [Dehalococcoidia bacterium]|nr:MAG: CoA transferase [Dehalococcoidia bacterium]